MNVLKHYSEWKKGYEVPTSEKINDIQLTAAVIDELHRVPQSKQFIQDKIIIDKLTSKYNISNERVQNVINTLHEQSILTRQMLIKQNEPAYEFAFTLRKVNDEFKTPWHLS